MVETYVGLYKIVGLYGILPILPKHVFLVWASFYFILFSLMGLVWANIIQLNPQAQLVISSPITNWCPKFTSSSKENLKKNPQYLSLKFKQKKKPKYLETSIPKSCLLSRTPKPITSWHSQWRCLLDFIFIIS